MMADRAGCHFVLLISFLVLLIVQVYGVTSEIWFKKHSCVNSDMESGPVSTGSQLIDKATKNRYYPGITPQPEDSPCNETTDYWIDWDPTQSLSILSDPTPYLLSRGINCTTNDHFNRRPCDDGFDGNPLTHYKSAGNSNNPWVRGDLCRVYTITRAEFINRMDHGSWTTNLHFSVAVTEADFDDYNATLCYEYPGPAMVDSQQEMMNCSTPMTGRFVQLMLRDLDLNIAFFNFAVLDVYGY